jgi:hypothetical protein
MFIKVISIGATPGRGKGKFPPGPQGEGRGLTVHVLAGARSGAPAAANGIVIAAAAAAGTVPAVPGLAADSRRGRRPSKNKAPVQEQKVETPPEGSRKPCGGATMKGIVKYAATATIAGALALAAAAPSEARHGRKAIGFGTGTAAARAAHDGGQYYSPGFYAYAPGYPYRAYAPRYRYDDAWRWSEEHSTNNFSIDSQR